MKKKLEKRKFVNVRLNLKNARKPCSGLLHEAEVKEHLLQRSYGTQDEEKNEIETLEETLGVLEENMEIITTQKEKSDLNVKDFQLLMSERDEKLASSEKEPCNFNISFYC